MKVRGRDCRLIGTEGSSPPLPYIEVSDSEGAALIGRGHAEEVIGEDAEPAKAPEKPKKAAKSEPEPKPEPEVAKGAPADPERVQTIVEGLDLVEPEHLEAEGDRAGKPKPEAIAEITGLADVTHAEVDAAVAAKAAE